MIDLDTSQVRTKDDAVAYLSETLPAACREIEQLVVSDFSERFAQTLQQLDADLFYSIRIAATTFAAYSTRSYDKANCIRCDEEPDVDYRKVCDDCLEEFLEQKHIVTDVLRSVIMDCNEARQRITATSEAADQLYANINKY